MKITFFCFFLALSLAACSDNQKDKIDKVNEDNAQKATDYIQKPIDQANEVRKMTEENYKDIEKQQE